MILCHDKILLTKNLHIAFDLCMCKPHILNKPDYSFLLNTHLHFYTKSEPDYLQFVFFQNFCLFKLALFLVALHLTLSIFFFQHLNIIFFDFLHFSFYLKKFIFLSFSISLLQSLYSILVADLSFLEYF